jgi:sodium-dependent phosphate transporter
VVTPSSEAAVEAHKLATRYDAATERLFSACQVFTASFASLAHGSNDVANAIAPLSVISSVWAHGGARVAATAATPAWCLAYGGLFMDLGLLLMGYKVMRNLGNNITYHSPSRGYCMELGALTTVLWASATGNAVSTTHCITGATVGVGLCTGSMWGVNWRMVAWTTCGWMLTLPAAALVSGVTFALIALSPKALSPAEAHPGLLWNTAPPPTMSPPMAPMTMLFPPPLPGR